MLSIPVALVQRALCDHINELFVLKIPAWLVWVIGYNFSQTGNPDCVRAMASRDDMENIHHPGAERHTPTTAAP